MITKQNKKGNTLVAILITLGVILLLAITIASWVAGSYNTLVSKDVSVENQWGKVQSAYERRLDLIPNLVATVRGSAEFEKSTVLQVAALRTGVTNAKNPEDMKPIDNQLNTITRSINIQVEAYPDLKSSENFRALQDELAGTENRVKWERDEYNNKVKDYQTTVRIFPNNILAGMYGFYPDKYKFFEATQGAENSPIVSFTE